MQIIPAPDYPTGGVIMGTEALRQAYLTGKGGVVIRSKADIDLRIAIEDEYNVDYRDESRKKEAKSTRSTKNKELSERSRSQLSS